MALTIDKAQAAPEKEVGQAAKSAGMQLRTDDYLRLQIRKNGLAPIEGMVQAPLLHCHMETADGRFEDGAGAIHTLAELKARGASLLTVVIEGRYPAGMAVPTH